MFWTYIFFLFPFAVQDRSPWNHVSENSRWERKFTVKGLVLGLLGANFLYNQTLILFFKKQFLQRGQVVKR